VGSEVGQRVGLGSGGGSVIQTHIGSFGVWRKWEGRKKGRSAPKRTPGGGGKNKREIGER
jgi:hypothetical protein